jgi:thiol-disulfide isomerase/thioredoxin
MVVRDILQKTEFEDTIRFVNYHYSVCLSSFRLQIASTAIEFVWSIFSSNDLVVVHFYADWATQCGPMNDVLEELAKQAELKVS